MTLADILSQTGHRFVTGVPDSTLTALCFEFSQRHDFVHAEAASEGQAISLATGQWLATTERPLVYMQNSGLPNALNPLLSLASSAAFDIPLTLVVGWRGRPGIVDEPQHRLIGLHTEEFLHTAEFETLIIDNTPIVDLKDSILNGINRGRRLALLVEPGTITSSARAPSPAPTTVRRLLPKTDLLLSLLSLAPRKHVLVGGIGHTSRQLMKLRIENGETATTDLHCVGAMGFASSVAAGIAETARETHVICLDGDGSFLMHGAATAAFAAKTGLKLTHLVLANGVHASVGGHPICSDQVDFVKVAEGLGYKRAAIICSLDELEAAIEDGKNLSSPQFLVAYVDRGDVEGLPRPDFTLAQGAQEFRRMHFFS